MRVLFLGTPEFAVPSLTALAGAHHIAAVFTQPDRPKGRGNVLAESAVKKAALELQIPVYQPERIRRPENFELLTSFAADIFVVVGYGQIIPQSIIDIPRYGILNVHASLLPKYRGAAPIQWAIANGETQTGVTIMQIDAGLDTGAMLRKEAVSILPSETAPELSARLAPLGAAALLTVIDEIGKGVGRPEKQLDTEATLAPILKKEDGRIDWHAPAQQIFNRWRGFNPWPGAYTTFRGQQLTVFEARPSEASIGQPGTIKTQQGRLTVHCGEQTAVELVEVQLAGKKRMTAQAFLNGYKLVENESLGDRR